MIYNLKKMFGQSGNFISISAPFSGEIKPLDYVQDDIFAKGTLGPGLVIIPNEKERIVKAPVGGEVLLMSDMSHAVMIKVKGEAEVLIHIGIGTVSLKGQFFTPIVKNGDFIKTGDPLLIFDQEQIKKANYSMATPIVIPTLGSFTNFEITKKDSVMCQEELIKIIKD